MKFKIWNCKDKLSNISNCITEKIYSKTTRALAGNTICIMGRWRTIWSDLNISSMYSAQPAPIIFISIPKINKVSISWFMYPPTIFNDCVWELLGICFFILWVRFHYTSLRLKLFYVYYKSLLFWFKLLFFYYNRY